MKKQPCPIHKLGDEAGHYFFGYYDKCPWNTAQSRVLAHRAAFLDRFPAASDEVEIGYFDLAQSNTYTALARTTAWNWQQGAQLQWVHVGGVEQILFNQRTDDGIFGCLLDPESGQQQTLASSIYTVSPDSMIALTLNYARLYNLRQDYGISGLTDPFKEEESPENDGIFRIDFPDGQPKQILSIAEVRALKKNPMDEGCMHWVNHLMFNPSGSRFCFLHRFMRPDGIVQSRLMSASSDGSELRLLFEGMVSHFDWLDEDHIFAWAGRRSMLASKKQGRPGIMGLARKGLKPIYYALGKPRILMQKVLGDSYFIIEDSESGGAQEVAKGVLTSDGHCTVSPDKEWILTDGYTDSKNRLPLYLWNLQEERAVELGRYPTPSELDGPLRVDLHPRFSRDGRQICIDSAMSGGRNMYVLDVSALTTEKK